jgi:phosphate transport system permease protein
VTAPLLAPRADGGADGGALGGAARARARRASATRASATGDRLYGAIILGCALFVPLLLLILAFIIVSAAWPTVTSTPLTLLVGQEWNPSRDVYGAFPALAGTLVSSALALLIATPLALGAAIASSEFAPPTLRTLLGFAFELLAAIPSVVYGLWGAYVLVPLVRAYLMPPLMSLSSGLPWLSGPAYGPSLLSSALVLAIMILPYIASVSRDVLSAVPRSQREAALALGATRWEVVRDAVLPYARAGIIGSIMLGLGRALGETMAVTMVIGNRHAMPTSLLDPAYTMAALLANEFAEATAPGHVSALMAVAALLLLITLLVNVAARALVFRTRHGAERQSTML